jgi:hypothetical protein
MNKKKILEQLAKLPTDETKALFMVEHIQKLKEQFIEAQDILEDKTYKFVEDFLNNGVDVPKDMRKYISIGKRYSDFIDMFRSRVAIDDCVISEEAQNLLMMARAEIQKLRGQIAGTKIETNAIKKDIRIMKNQIYCHQEIELLETDTQKRKAKQLCEGVSQKYKISEIIRGVKRDAKNEN